MITQIDVIVAIQDAEKEKVCRKAVAEKLSIQPKQIVGMRLLKSSIDARCRQVMKQLRYLVAIDEELPALEEPSANYTQLPANAARVIIVGSGPAGLFAAINCIKRGLRPIILERGKDVVARRFDLRPINCEGLVNEDSNYCFGEGGAGTFSDGKLYTRATKRGSVQEVYGCFVAHGASPDILTDAHPHIGSNKLPKVVQAMRESILAAGGEVHFNHRVTALLRSSDGKRLHGVRTANGVEWEGIATILATGHSARDIYQLLHDEGLLLERKAFAIGVRIEHPQSIIDRAQYHLSEGESRPDYLPAARYTLATKIRNRGVHSFCMCPGGFVVPAATANDEVVVNGMSLSRRNSPFSNSGFVVSVEPEDSDIYAAEYGVLSGIAYQKKLEQATAIAGGGMMRAPAQRVSDFLQKTTSESLLESSYKPGLTSYNLHDLLPEAITSRMIEGLQFFDRKLRGFAGEQAMLIGCETRTSSPVRIPRSKESLEHPELAGLYPCGEGAGYAGGIVSAALDGLRCSDAIIQP